MNRSVTRCIYLYSWSLDLQAFETKFKLNFCFRTHGLFPYTLSYRFGNIWTFSKRIFVFPNRAVKRCMFSYSWFLDIRAFEQVCKLKLCFLTNDIFPYTFLSRFLNVCTFSYRIFVISNRPVTRCMFSYSWSLGI